MARLGVPVPDKSVSIGGVGTTAGRGLPGAPGDSARDLSSASIPIEGYTPRRRGDSARRVKWPEQGGAEVRPLAPE